jgi:hypothetical protein
MRMRAMTSQRIAPKNRASSCRELRFNPALSRSHGWYGMWQRQMVG